MVRRFDDQQVRVALAGDKRESTDLVEREAMRVVGPGQVVAGDDALGRAFRPAQPAQRCDRVRDDFHPGPVVFEDRVLSDGDPGARRFMRPSHAP
jgi:hypothetical protein